MKEGASDPKLKYRMNVGFIFSGNREKDLGLGIGGTCIWVGFVHQREVGCQLPPSILYMNDHERT